MSRTLRSPPDEETEARRRAAERAGSGSGPDELRQELERRTRELEQSETRFRDVIERNADAIVVVDRQGVVRFANRMAAKLFGHDELLGTHFGFPVVAGETTELDLPRSNPPAVVEMRVVESAWEGQTAYIASLRDVTERKRAEETARRLISEHAARTAAEDAARKLQFLLDSSTVLSSTLEHQATLEALARLCVSEIADWAVVYCVDANEEPRRLEVAHRDPAMAGLVAELREAPLELPDAHPIREVLRTREPLLLRTVGEEALARLAPTEARRTLVQRMGIRSFMLVPMVARGHALGAIALVSADGDRPFDERDLALAGDIAVRAALAVDNARLYGEARRANQTKSDFLAVVSHDLRTPLTAIIGYAELLELGVPEPLTDGSRKQVERIRTSARHLLYLLNELLAFARLDAGREELRLRDVDLRDIGREIDEVLEPLARERGLRIELAFPAHPVLLETDPDKLRQVLLNLVGNAIKYTKQGGVRLECPGPADGVAVLRVRDTGPGIAAEHLERIFEPFWQVDPDQRLRGGGTGLGLSVVRRLVKLLGGDVEVASTVGEGSTFTVTLPVR